MPTQKPARSYSGCLAAEQGTGGLLAAFGHAGNDCLGGLDVELACGKVVQEEERGCALNQDVVDAHGNEVDAHGVVLVKEEGQLELGAHAVRGGNKHRIRHAVDVRTEQAAEAADVGNHTLGVGFGNDVLDAGNKGVAGLDVDAGSGICFGPF